MQDDDHQTLSDCNRGRAQILRLLADVASGGWEDEDGREISTDAAREAIAVLRQLWCAR